MSLASYGQRLGAHILDSLLIAIFLLGALLVLAAGASALSAPDDDPWLAVSMWFLVGGAIMYKPWFEGSFGQTVGKRIVGIRVVRATDGRYVDYGQAFGRAAAHLLNFGIGFLLPLWDPRRQAIHDKVANTIVVRDLG